MKKILTTTILVLIIIQGFSKSTPIAYYPFVNGVKDESGNGNNGVIGGSATVSNGNLVLNGTSDFVSIANSSFLNFSKKMTMYVRFKLNKVNGSRYFLHKMDGSYKGFVLRVLDGKLGFSFGNTQYQNYSQSSINVNQWYSVAITYDSSEYKVYINGNLDSKGSVDSDLSSSNTLLIGKHSQDVDYLDGEIDEIRLYNYRLTESEAIQIVNLNPINYYPNLKIYPNPFIETLHIDEINNELFNVKIFDVVGNLIKQDSNVNLVELKNLSRGLYILIIFNQELEEVYRLRITKN